MDKILITGATGNFGKAAINFLLKKNIPAVNIVAFIRNESKAEDLKAADVEIRIGDYTNIPSMIEAFKGIDKVLFISASDIAERTKHHENVMTAIKASDVKYIVYTSFIRDEIAKDSPIGFLTDAHIKTEQWLKESGKKYTLLRNNLYLDYVPVYIGEKVLETGVYFPAGEGRGAYALRDDMAEAAANVLISNGHENMAYNISNSVTYSFGDVAEVLTAITGKTVKYISPSQEEYEQTLTKAGIPVDYIGMFAAFAESIKLGEFNKPGNDLENLLGRKPISLKTYFQSIYGSK
jgi:NAD(P)H dehydrogenase (quinone)